ncbi:MAG: hypothetical protein V1833_01965 [Elusimicrobiota bacterium]
MSVQALSPVQIRKIGFKALAEVLGTVDMIRFIHFFETGIGDYTGERKKWLGEHRVPKVIKEIRGCGRGRRD